MKTIKNILLSMVILVSSLGIAVDRKSTTTVINPAGDVTTQVYFGSFLFETNIFKGNSTKLSTIDICYNGASYPCTPTTVALPVIQQDAFTLVPGIASPSQTETVYNAYGLSTDDKTYDYGPSLVGERTTLYCVLGNTKVKDHPCTVTGKNSGGTTVSQSIYAYDANGNLLTRSMLVAGSTFLTESYTYSSKGILATATGLDGSTVTYNNNLCNGIEAGSVVYPITGTQTIGWNCNGAVPTSTTDINGSTYTVTYSDPFWRPTSGIDSLGTTLSLKYTPNTTESALSFANSSNDNLTTVNVAGRPIVYQSRQSKGSAQYDTVSQEYDNMGRQVKSSLPCIQSSSSPCPTTQITTTYDSGSIPTVTMTDALGGTISTSYSKGDVTTLLSTTAGRQVEHDGLGRVTSVCEISSEPGAGSCGQRVARTGFVTNYTYDSMGNVLTIVQGAQTRTLTYDDLSRVLSVTQPETGTTTYTYDTTASCGGTTSNGNLVKVVDNIGNTICYKYDSISRLTSVTHTGPNPTDDKFYVYDAATVNGHAMANAKGRLAEAYTCTSCPGTKKTDIGYSYDTIGNIADTYQSTVNSGGYYHLAFTVYPNDAVHTMHMDPQVIPDITYGLDGEGRVSSVNAGTTSLMSSVTRGPANDIESLSYGSSTVDTFGHDSLLRPTTFSFQSAVGSVIGNVEYNADGTVKDMALTDPFNSANNQACTYGYDTLIRLSSANCGTVNQKFSYDRYGNITKSGTFSFTPTYNTTTNRITAIGAVTPTYDADGNLLTDDKYTYTWDAEGRMLSVGTTSVIYNAFGQMAEQTTGTTHQQFIYMPSGEKLALMNGQSLVLARIGMPGKTKAVYTTAGLAYYTHADSVGNVRLTTTQSQAVVSDLSYAPYGEPYNNIGVPTSTLTFTGHNQDTVSGLYDTLFREYNPLQSRWVSSDKNGNASLKNPQSFNLYTYVLNNPLGFSDKSGADCGDAITNVPCVSTTIDVTCTVGCISPGTGEGDSSGFGGGIGSGAETGGGGGGSAISDEAWGADPSNASVYAEGTGVWTGDLWVTGTAALSNLMSLGAAISRADPIGFVVEMPIGGPPEIFTPPMGKARKFSWQKYKPDPNLEGKSDQALFMLSSPYPLGGCPANFSHVVCVVRDALLGEDLKNPHGEAYNSNDADVFRIPAGTLSKDTSRQIIKRWLSGQDIFYAAHDVGDPAFFDMLETFRNDQINVNIEMGETGLQALANANDAWRIPKFWGQNEWLTNFGPVLNAPRKKNQLFGK